MDNEQLKLLLSTFNNFSQSINQLISWKENNIEIKNILQNNDEFNQYFNDQKQKQILPIYNNNIEINQQIKKGKKRKLLNEKRNIKMIKKEENNEDEINPDDSISNVVEKQTIDIISIAPSKTKSYYQSIINKINKIPNKEKTFNMMAEKCDADAKLNKLIDIEIDTYNNNKKKENNDDDNIEQWRKSDEYQNAINIYPLSINDSIISKLIQFSKELDENQIDKLKVNLRNIILKGNVETKIAHENMIVLAHIDIKKHNLKKTNEIINYLYKKDPHWFSIDTKKIVSFQTFESYYHLHKNYYYFIKRYPGHRYSNMTWHDIVKYTPKKLLNIYDDAKKLNMMEKNNKLYFLKPI